MTGVHGNNCNTLNYVSRRICALEGSSVNISSVYSFPFHTEPHSKSWYKKKQNYEEKNETLAEAAGRVEYHDNMKNQHTLTIKNVEKNDSAEYRFRFHDDTGSKVGVTLTVTGNSGDYIYCCRSDLLTSTPCMDWSQCTGKKDFSKINNSPKCATLSRNDIREGGHTSTNQIIHVPISS